jgi:CelD/BcsL family acetyltransferase involved in cellulose biosynthesis
MQSRHAARAGDSLDVQLRPLPRTPDLFFEASWRDLERRSLHSNPFLSPSVLLSQPEGSLTSTSTQLLTVMDADGRWYAAGVFEIVSGSRQLPAPHLQAVCGEHCYLSGILLDSSRADDWISAIWKSLDDQGLHGLSFPQFPIESQVGKLLAAHCAKRQLTTVVDGVQHRASVTDADASNDLGISEKRAKSLQKGRRALAKHGTVWTRFRGCSRDDQSAINQFLLLESLGWKGELRSSLLSCRHDSEWFRTVALSLSGQDRIRFAELLIDDRVIASMCLFRAQSEYFAFKIGWDPQFERGCPGFLLAADIRSHLGQLPGCTRIDGCARPGSFLDHVWPGRMAVGNVVFTTNRPGSMMATGTQWARSVLRKWRGGSEPKPTHTNTGPVPAEAQA